jgi:hypothetical protein
VKTSAARPDATRLPCSRAHLVFLGSFRRRHPTFPVSLDLTSTSSFFLLPPTAVLSLRRHTLRPTDLCTFELFPRRFCIYFGHIRRQTSCTEPSSCILSAHLPHYPRFVSRRLRIRSLRHIAWRRLQPLGSRPSTHSSKLRHYELQHHFRRLSYTPQGPQSILQGR